jgi:hypothetical protein
MNPGFNAGMVTDAIPGFNVGMAASSAGPPIVGGFGMDDTGCEHSLAGSTALHAYQQRAQALGLMVKRYDLSSFQREFSSGKRVVLTGIAGAGQDPLAFWVLPVVLGNASSYFVVAEVPWKDCPLLLARTLTEDLWKRFIPRYSGIKGWSSDLLGITNRPYVNETQIDLLADAAPTTTLAVPCAVNVFVGLSESAVEDVEQDNDLHNLLHSTGYKKDWHAYQKKAKAIFEENAQSTLRRKPHAKTRPEEFVPRSREDIAGADCFLFQGCWFILFVNLWSSFIRAAPLSGPPNAAHVINFLKQVFSAGGAVSRIILDAGPEFCNKAVYAWARSVRLLIYFVPGGCKWAGGVAERAVQSLKAVANRCASAPAFRNAPPHLLIQHAMTVLGELPRRQMSGATPFFREFLRHPVPGVATPESLAANAVVRDDTLWVDIERAIHAKWSGLTAIGDTTPMTGGFPMFSMVMEVVSPKVGAQRLDGPFQVIGRLGPKSGGYIIQATGVVGAGRVRHADVLQEHTPFSEYPADCVLATQEVVNGYQGGVFLAKSEALNVLSADQASEVRALCLPAILAANKPLEPPTTGIRKGKDHLHGPEASKWREAYAAEWAGIAPRVKAITRRELPQNACLIPATCQDKVKRDEKKTFKNRWIVCASEKFDKRTDVHTHAPTLSPEGFWIILTFSVALGVAVCTADVKQAFLTLGEYAKEDQVCVLIPPRNPFPGDPRLWDDKALYLVCAPIYGFKDVPHLYFLKQDANLRSQGCITHPYDRCLYFKAQGVVSNLAAVGVTVDDTIGLDNQSTRAVLKKYSSELPFGGDGLSAAHHLKYCSLNIDQSFSGSKFVDQRDYIAEDLKSIAKVAAGDVPYAVTRGLRGELQWCGRTRPAVLSRCSITQVAPARGPEDELYVLSADVRGLNNAAAYLKSTNHFRRRIAKLNLTKLCIITFVDSSFANCAGNKTQGGRCTFLAEEPAAWASSQKVGPKFLRDVEYGEETVPAVLIATHSARLRRVANSTLSAETIQSVVGLDGTISLGMLLSAILGRKVRTHLVGDCGSLRDNLDQPIPTGATSKRLSIDIDLLAESLRLGELSSYRHVPTDYNLADELTKLFTFPEGGLLTRLEQAAFDGKLRLPVYNAA